MELLIQYEIIAYITQNKELSSAQFSLGTTNNYMHIKLCRACQAWHM